MREVERRLPTKLHDHTLGLLQVRDLEYVLESERLEVQLVADVEVGRDRLRVRVDHDGLVPGLAERQHRLHTAVVELDPLPDPVRTAAENDHLLAVRALDSVSVS